MVSFKTHYELRGSAYKMRLPKRMSLRRAKEWFKECFKVEVLPEGINFY